MTAPEGDTLATRVRAYWDTHVHDLELARSPAGTLEFFDELDGYRFRKLDYLPRLVDFGGWPGRDVLEVGCGTGIDLVRFARGGARVTGVDLSDTAVALARQNVRLRGLEADLRVLDAGCLPFADGSFDLVYGHGVLQYAADPGAIVREAHRVLRPGGEAIFMVYNRRSWLAWMSRVTGVALEHQDAPVLRLYTAAGFDSLLAAFPRRRVVPERFPVATELHRGLRGTLFNRVFVPAFHVLPQAWVRPLGWHLMAFCAKETGQ